MCLGQKKQAHSLTKKFYATENGDGYHHHRYHQVLNAASIKRSSVRGKRTTTISCLNIQPIWSVESAEDAWSLVIVFLYGRLPTQSWIKSTVLPLYFFFFFWLRQQRVHIPLMILWCRTWGVPLELAWMWITVVVFGFLDVGKRLAFFVVCPEKNLALSI